jgi:Zn-dependent protease
MDIALRLFSAFFSLWFLVIFLLLIHETGHLIVLAYFKLKPERIIVGNVKIFSLNVGGIKHEFGLFPFFAFTISDDYAKAPQVQRVVVALAGPATSLILGAGLHLCNFLSPGWYTLIAANASIALGLWNLIPFPPLDGWPLLEWQLQKHGLVITHRGRSVLLGLGLISIAVLSVMTWH